SDGAGTSRSPALARLDPGVRRRVVSPARVSTPDLDGFLAEVDSRDLFDTGAEVVVARAPGRLDLMGGIADYSGSLVFQWPIEEATFAAVQLTTDDRVIAESVDGAKVRRHETSATALREGDYEDARRLLSSDAGDRWSAYVLGVFVALVREKDAPLRG